MKLLKISNGCGHFLNENSSFSPIDEICKEDLMRLVNSVLTEESVGFDDYDEEKVKNQAHQIIYRSVHQKLISLRDRRQEFIDQSKRLYLVDYEKYREDSR